MFRGHFQGGSIRPHQAFARAIFTPNLVQCHQELTTLGLFSLDPQRFVDALTLGENPEYVISLMRSDPEAASDIAHWLRDSAAAHPSPATVRTASQSLQYFYQQHRHKRQGDGHLVDNEAAETPKPKPFVEPRPLLTPRPPPLGLEGLLEDFLSLSSSSGGGSSPMNSPGGAWSESSAEDPSSGQGADGDGLDADADGDDQQESNDDGGDVFDFSWWLPDPLPPVGSNDAFFTLYFRVMGARILALRLGNVKKNQIKDRVLLRKLERFVQAHHLLFHWVHQRGPLSLEQRHLDVLYRPLGPASMYACDRALIRVTRTAHVMRERPLEVLEKQWPNLCWRPENVSLEALALLGTSPRLLQPADDGGANGWVGWAPLGAAYVDSSTHRLYMGVIWVLNQCMRKLRKPDSLTERQSYALWVYYVSWVDFFHYCFRNGRFDDAFLRLPHGSEVSRFGKVSYEETASPWSLYGTCDTRTFCAGDLPNFFHVLVTLPLWGEQQTPPYFLGKLYQKSLPFAGARRHIVKLAVKCILDHPPFWRVFSRLMWVMLANLYPGDLAGPYGTLGMRSLLRIKELCENRDMLIGTLLAHQPGMKEIWERKEIKESKDPFLQRLAAETTTKKSAAVAANGGPLIVATMFRMHLLYMGSFNSVYVEQARTLIDWDYHKQEAVRLSSLIRQRGLFAQDAFAQARTELSKTVKSPHSHVHRIRRHSIPMMVQEKMDDLLEKNILKNRQIFMKEAEVLADIVARTTTDTLRAHRFLNETKMGALARSADLGPEDVTPDLVVLARELAENCVRNYNQELDLGVKSAILNALLYVEPADRLKRPTFMALLQREQYGGISIQGAEIMWRLVLVASDKAAPKDFARYLGAMNMHDFLVATYYFNAVVQLDKIHFAALDADTNARTHQTMRERRYQLGLEEDPEDDDLDSMYEVVVSLCCNRISSMMGQNKYGVRRVALDLERHQLVCMHSKPTRSTAVPPSPTIVLDNGDDDDDNDDNDGAHHHADQEDQDGADVDAVDEVGAENAEGADDEDDADDPADRDHVVLHQAEAMAEEQGLDDEGAAMALLGLESADLIGDAMVMGGKGAAKARIMHDRKQVRNQRKAFSKVPCGQPVLVISLRGRALLWGNILDKRVQIMFCPTCGGLHMYTIFGMAMLESDREGGYRCAECMRTELTHLSYNVCAFCGKMAPGPECVLNVMCPVSDTTYNGDAAFDPLSPTYQGSLMQPLYFCRAHYKVAKRHAGLVTKADLWNILKYVQEARALRRAKGLMNSGRIGYGNK